MEQYISKDALVAEIDKVIDEPAPLHDQQCSWEDGYYCGLYKAESIIDTFDVKEVDLEKEIELEYNPIDGLSFEEFKRIAKHFFELGIKTIKGEVE